MTALPADSATAQAAYPGVLWGPKEELLAQLVELTSLGNRVAHKGFGFKGELPQARVPRPDAPTAPVLDRSPQPRRLATPAEVRSFFAGRMHYRRRSAQTEG